MPISVSCPQCSATLPVPDELAGRSIRCGGCQGVVTVPAQPTAPARPVARAIPVSAAAERKPKPIARKVKPDAIDDDPPPRKAVARRVTDDDEEEERERRPSARRPVAKKRSQSLLNAGAMFWLFLLMGVGGVGSLLFVYSMIWGGSRKSDSAAQVFVPEPAKANPIPEVANAALPAPVPRPEMQVPNRVAEPAPGAEFVQQPNFARQPPQRPGMPVAPVVEPPKPIANDLVSRFRDKIQVTSSSDFPQWPAQHLIDGNYRTSWFPQQVQIPGAWVKLEFPERITVSRVLIIGNYDPQWPAYQVTTGTLELLNDQGRVVASRAFRGKLRAINNFEFSPNTPVANIRAIRLKEMADTNGHLASNMALSEIQVE